MPEPERAGGDDRGDPQVPLTTDERISALSRDGLLDESAEELYEHAPTAYFSSLLDGTLVRVNETLLRWTGYTREELVGRKRLHDLLPPGARIYYETHYAPLLQMQDGVREIAVELVSSDGRRLPVLMNSVVVRDESGAARLVRTTAFNASERRAYERELLRSRAEAESRARAVLALEHVAEGVVLVGEDGDLQILNPAAEQVFDVSAATVVGRRATDVLEGWRAVVERVAVTPAGESPVTNVVPVERQRGTQWLAVAAVDAGGAAVYTVRDVTDERQLDQLRSDLVAIVSHELRTPLTGALGAAQTLGARYESLSDDSRRRLVAMIVEQAERLASIVDQVLLTSRLDSGEIDTSSETFDGVDVLDAVVRGVDAGARSRVVVDAHEGVLIRGDLDRLRQAVGNVVDNALKYSDGQVRLALAVRSLSARITVTDDGPGIAAPERERIFEKFFRLDPAQRGGVGGTGLGLYIARELVERMDGRIGVLPRPRGTTVFFDLPLAHERP